MEQLPPLRVQVPELRIPGALLLNVTLPLGIMAVPKELSVTIAVQVAGAFTGVEAGVQLTLIEVERLLTVRLKLPEPVE